MGVENGSGGCGAVGSPLIPYCRPTGRPVLDLVDGYDLQLHDVYEYECAMVKATTGGGVCSDTRRRAVSKYVSTREMLYCTRVTKTRRLAPTDSFFYDVQSTK